MAGIKSLVGLFAVFTVVVYGEPKSKKCLPLQWQASVVGSMAMDVLGIGLSMPVTIETATDFEGKRESFHQHLAVHENMTVDMNMFTDYNKVRSCSTLLSHTCQAPVSISRHMAAAHNSISVFCAVLVLSTHSTQYQIIHTPALCCSTALFILACTCSLPIGGF